MMTNSRMCSPAPLKIEIPKFACGVRYPAVPRNHPYQVHYGHGNWDSHGNSNKKTQVCEWEPEGMRETVDENGNNQSFHGKIPTVFC